MAPEVVIMTTSGATSDDKVGIVISLSFQCNMLEKQCWFIIDKFHMNMRVFTDIAVKYWKNAIEVIIQNSLHLLDVGGHELKLIYDHSYDQIGLEHREL